MFEQAPAVLATLETRTIMLVWDSAGAKHRRSTVNSLHRYEFVYLMLLSRLPDGEGWLLLGQALTCL